MGGAAAGEIASDMAVKIVLNELQTQWIAKPVTSIEGFVRSIKAATKAANEQINAYAANHPEYRGMGTTATIAGLLGDSLYLAQVGDSRAYLVRNGVARQITKDQSLMQKLIEAGELTEEEAEHSERRNIILQALGPEPTIKVDLTHQRIRRGDTLVLCSDGLSGQVTKDDIADVVRTEPDLTNACKMLIDRANANGGPDNITVILARFEGSALQDANGGDEVGHQIFPLPETGQTPAMSIDRVIDTNSPTEEMQAIPSSRTTKPIVQQEEPPRESSRRKTVPLGEDSVPPVSPQRRNAGRLIAIGLLAILVLGAAYLVIKQTRAVTETTGAPPGSPRH
jgi:protein phosphatase